MAAYRQFLSNLDFGVVSGAQKRPGLLQIRLAERLGPAADTSAPARGFETGVNPLTQEIALEFGVLRFSAKTPIMRSAGLCKATAQECHCGLHVSAPQLRIITARKGKRLARPAP